MLSLLLAKKNLKLIYGLGVILLPMFLSAQWAFEGPIPPITSGYGSFGSDSVINEFFSIAPDSTSECDDTIRGIISYPANINQATPVVFTLPGSGYQGFSDSTMLEYFGFYHDFIASNGYVAVSMQWNNSSWGVWGCAHKMVTEMVKTRSHIIDSTRVGFRGYSWGAGAANWLGLSLFTDRNWGSNGRFVWADAGGNFVGWNIGWPDDIGRQTDSGLAAMPDDVLYFMTLHDMDNTFDPRMGIDLYNFMGVPDSNKEFYVIKGDTINNYIYWATHFTLGTYSQDSNQFYTYITKHDALDYWYGTRLLHAAMETAWGTDPVARRICLGNGDSLQTIWAGGQLRSPIVTDTPWMTTFDSWNSGAGYMSPCEVTWNMRQYVTANACFTLDIPEIEEQNQIKLFPNPSEAGQTLEIKATKEIEHIEVFTYSGESVLFSTKNKVEIYKSGNYIMGVKFNDGTSTALKFIVN